MPGIANVNYTVMQGDAAREMQNIKNFAQDANQPVVAAKMEKNEEEKRVTVQESEDSDTAKLNPDKDNKDKNRRRKRRGSSKGDSDASESMQAAAKKPGRRSRLLDIVA